jgi:predicted PurR-regulated permease PerM
MKQNEMSSLPDDQPSSANVRPVGLRFDLLNIAATTAVVFLVVQAFSFVDLIRRVLLLLVLAILLATAIQPLVARLRRSGVGRGPSVLSIYLVAVAAVVAFVVAASSAIAEQAAALIADLPKLSERIRDLTTGLPAGPIRETAARMTESLSLEQIGSMVTSSLASGTLYGFAFVTLTVFETAFAVITVFVLAYFWIAERTAIRRLVVQAFRGEHRLRAFTIWESVEDKLGAWIRGQLLLMLIIGVAQGLGYAVLGLPFVLLLAVFAALAEAIPMAGPYLGAIPAILMALTVSPRVALILVAYTVVLHLVESNVLVPRVMERAVGLSPLAVVLTLLVGVAVGGIVGAVLSIPIAAVIQTTIRDLVQARKASAESGAVSASQTAEGAVKAGADG